MALPRLGNNRISSRAVSSRNEQEFARNYASLARYVAAGRAETQSVKLEKDNAYERADALSTNNTNLISTGISLIGEQNDVISNLIAEFKSKTDKDDDEIHLRRVRNVIQRRVAPRGGAAAARPGATRQTTPPVTNRRMNLRPGQIEVGGGLYYDTATNRFHNPSENNRMVSREEAMRRGATAPSSEQIDNAKKERVASRAQPSIEAPGESLVPREAPPRAGALQKADQAVGRALSSTTGKVAVGGLTIVAAIPLIYQAYEEIKNIPTDIARDQYERQVVTIISRLFASGVALPYIGAVMGTLVGTAVFPGVGTMAGLVGGILGGSVAGYFLGDKAEEIASKLVEHFYDRAQRQKEDEKVSSEFNRRRIEQRNLPIEQRGLPEDINELEEMLRNTVDASTRGPMLDRARARGLIPQIERRIQEMRSRSSAVQDSGLQTPASNLVEESGSSIANVLGNIHEFNKLTFEASTIVFDGDMSSEDVFGQPTAQFMGASGAFSSSGGGGGGATVLSSFGGISGIGRAGGAAPSSSGGGETAPPPAPSGGGAPSGAAAPPPSTSGFFDAGRREQTSQDFNTELNAVASRLGVQPNDLLAVMRSETGGTLSPSIRNPSGATGLIQFMPATARGLGTTTEDLAKMSQVEQLKYVESYFRSVGLPRGASAGMIYSYVFMPGKARRNPNELAVAGTPAYAQNAGLDVNGDGIISIDDLDNFLRGSRRGRAGSPVTSTSQTGSVIGGASTSAEAERMRRQSTTRNAAIPASVENNNSSGASATAQSRQAAAEDVPLRYRLQQAIA